MGGSTKTISTTPKDINMLRGSMVNWLMQGGAPSGTQAAGPNVGVPLQQTNFASQVGGSAAGGYAAQGMPNNGMSGGTGAWERSQAMNQPTGGFAGQPSGGLPMTGGPMISATSGSAMQGQESRGWIPGMSGGTGAWERGKAAYDAQTAAGGFGGQPSTGLPMTGGPMVMQGQYSMFNGMPGGQNSSGSAVNTNQSFGGRDFASAAGPGVSPVPGASGGRPPQSSDTSGMDWTQGGTRAIPGAANPAFNNIFAQGPQGGPVQSTFVGALPNPGQINPNTIQQGSFGAVSGPSQANIPGVNAQQIDPRAGDPMSAFMQVASQLNLNNIPGTNGFNRGQARDVGAQASSYNPTQSVDTLGGKNSAFFNNMVEQLKPAFEQNRAESLAAAKAGLGNMGAGSSVANSLGTAMNRSLGQEQATLANYATQGIQTEVGRQLQDSAQNAQVGMANANRSLSADQGNQAADLQFLNTLVNQGGMAGNLALGAGSQNLQAQIANQGTKANLGTTGANNALQALIANQGADLNAQGQNAGNALQQWFQSNQLGQNAQQANMGANLQALLANQGAINSAQGQNIQNWMNQGQFNANLAQNTNNLNAQLGQMYQQLSTQVGQQNAQNFLNMLMGMGTTGVGGNQVVQSGGAGALLQPIAAGVGSYFGSRGGN